MGIIVKVIKVEDLTVKYDPMQEMAVENISFELKEGQIGILIGPNGSGKTTILKAILGLISYSGNIKVLEREVFESYQNIGYVPQRPTFDLSFPVTVKEFLEISLSNCEDKSKRKLSNIERSLKTVNAERLLEKPLRKLSGGQLQRVLLARALAHNPKLLILDEPETGIDVGGEQNLYDLLTKLKKEKDITILISSHELDIVFQYADKVICVNKQLMCFGVPREVLTPKVFEKLYGQNIKIYGHRHK